MKLLRLRVRDFRGVAEREVKFSSTGVTVIIGPNEIGKSSLADAIDLILEEPDSTEKQFVKDIKPVNRDAGPFVELEFETGPYHLLYSKRFLRHTETKLEITRPRHENLTGRDAHNRVRNILDETTDLALWRSLRVMQGTAIGQSLLPDSAALSTALDRAAGAMPTEAEDSTLYDAVTREYSKFWTPTGKANVQDADLARTLSARDAEIAGLEQRILALESDVEKSVRLTSEIAQLKAARIEQAAGLAEYESAWQEIETEQRRAKEIEAQAEAAQALAEKASLEARARAKSIEDLSRVKVAQTDIMAELAASAPAVAATDTRLAIAQTELEAARVGLRAADLNLEHRRAALDAFRDERELIALEGRLERANAAAHRIAEAERVVAGGKVDDRLLVQIRKAYGEAERAGARAEAVRTTVRMTGLGSGKKRAETIEVNGEPVALASGEQVSRVVEKGLNLTIPGAFRIEITAGDTEEGADVASTAEAAEAERSRLLELGGVLDLTAAIRAAEVRSDAVREIAEQKRILEEALRDSSLMGLEARYAEASARIGAAGQPSISADAQPGDATATLDETRARAAVVAAEEALATARGRLDDATAELDLARQRHDALVRERQEAEARLSVGAQDLAAIESRLVDERALASDEDLSSRSSTAAGRAQSLAEQAHVAAARLASGEGARAQILRENARDALARTERDLTDRGLELADVTATLRALGEVGLTDQLNAATVARNIAYAELKSWRKRAEARRLLYEIMTEARSEERARYLEPLRRQIQHLGSLLFDGADFDVALDNKLQILERTLASQSISWDGLSMGTKEQLSILSRLACAILVSPDGGVPLILDDVLGYSDPERLERMGAILSFAGQQCQVIVLTCEPDRYQYVGNATTIHLGAGVVVTQASASQ